MAQPAGQVGLKPDHASEYCFYAQGAAGIWDARAGALLTKTGTAGMSVEGGANVALGNNATSYALASAINQTGDWSIVLRARENAGAGQKSMVCGMNNATADFIWLTNSSSAFVVRAASGDFSVANAAPTTMGTWIAVHDATAFTLKIYRDGAQVGATLSTGGAAKPLKLNCLLNGYTGTSFSLLGAFEMLSIIPSKLDAAGIAERTADPYLALDNSVNATAEGGAGTGAGSGYGEDAMSNGDAVGETGTGTGAGSGFGNDATGSVGGTISITAPAQYKMHQRNALNVGSIDIAGAYTGAPTGIQARFNGSAWATIVASPAGGTYAGTLNNCPVGQGTLEVRFADDTAVTASVSTIGIGDIFIVAGQSNNCGRATQKVDPVASAFTAVKYGRDNTWKPLTEATTVSGSFDEGISAAGSYFGALSNLLQANGVPVAFVPCGQGSTTAANWQPPTPHTNTSFLYGIALTRALAVGDHKAMIWYQGEGDTATSQPTYQTQTHNVLDNWYADTGRPTFFIKICRWSASADPVRASQDTILATNTHIAGSADANVWASGDVHYQTVTEINNVAAAVYAGLVTAFYTQADGTGETGTGTGAGAGSGVDATGEAGAETGAGSGTGSGAGNDAAGDALAEAGTGTGIGLGAGEDASGGVAGDATGESGSGIGAGSGVGQDASGEAMAETGAGIGVGSGSGNDAIGGDANTLEIDPRFIIRASPRNYTIARRSA